MGPISIYSYKKYLFLVCMLVVLTGCGTAFLPTHSDLSIEQEIHVAKSVGDYFDIQKKIDEYPSHDRQYTADLLDFYRAKAILGKLDITFFRFLSIFSNASNSEQSPFEIINATMKESRTDLVFYSCDTSNCETAYFKNLKMALSDMEEIKNKPLYKDKKDDIELMRAILSIFYAESLLSTNYEYDEDGITHKHSVGASNAYQNVFVSGKSKITFNQALDIFKNSASKILNGNVSSEIQTEFNFVYNIEDPNCTNQQNCGALTTLLQGSI